MAPLRTLIVRWQAPSVMHTPRAGLEPATPEKTMFIQTEPTPNPGDAEIPPGPYRAR